MNKKHTMTMTEFRKHLALYPDEWEVGFVVNGIQIHFTRPKKRGDDYVILEFEEIDAHPLKSSR